MVIKSSDTTWFPTELPEYWQWGGKERSHESSETEARGAAQCGESSLCRQTCLLQLGCKGSSPEPGTSSCLCRNFTDSVRHKQVVWYCQNCVYSLQHCHCWLLLTWRNSPLGLWTLTAQELTSSRLTFSRMSSRAPWNPPSDGTDNLLSHLDLQNSVRKVIARLSNERTKKALQWRG